MAKMKEKCQQQTWILSIYCYIESIYLFLKALSIKCIDIQPKFIAISYRNSSACNIDTPIKKKGLKLCLFAHKKLNFVTIDCSIYFIRMYYVWFEMLMHWFCHTIFDSIPKRFNCSWLKRFFVIHKIYHCKLRNCLSSRQRYMYVNWNFRFCLLKWLISTSAEGYYECMTELISVLLKTKRYNISILHKIRWHTIKLKHLMQLISIHILSNIHLKLVNRQLNEIKSEKLNRWEGRVKC